MKKAFYNFSLIFITAIIPWITFVKLSHWPGFETRFFKTLNTHADIFFWYKSIFIILFGTLFAIIIFKNFAKNIGKIFTMLKLIICNVKYSNKNIACILMLFYSFLLTISVFFSENIFLSFMGFPEQNEGLLVLLAYNIFFYVAYVQARKVNYPLIFLFCFISAAFMSLLSIAQFFGYFTFNSDFVAKYLMPESYGSIKISSIWGENHASGTFYNPNYLGSYCSIIIPTFLVWSSGLVSWRKYFATFPISILFFSMLFTSVSRAAIIGIGMSILFTLIISRRIKLLISLLAAAFLLVNLASFRYSMTTLQLLNYVQAAFFSGVDPKFEPNIQKINTVNSNLIFNSTSLNFIATGNMTNIKIYSSNNAEINYTKADNKFTTLNSEYSNLSFSLENIEGRNIYTLHYPLSNLRFAFTEKGARIYDKGAFLKAETPVQFDLPINDLFASYRGYIWRRALPLLKSAVFIGKGPGHFPLDFPQNDYVGKINYFGNYEIILNKPHNMYLQIAHASGILSLLIFLAAVIFTLIMSTKVILKNNKYSASAHSPCNLLLALSAGVVGYLVSGLFNDSSLGVAPIFWVFFGLMAGLASNLFHSQFEYS